MVWLSKREIAVYLLLEKAFRNRTFNIGEALDILSIINPNKRMSLKIIKRLKAKGFLKAVDTFNYRVVDLETAFTNYLLEYIASRIVRIMKSRGIELKSYVKKQNGEVHIVLKVDRCDEEIVKVLKRISEVLEMFEILC